jgi:signal transduction histidine kinase
MDAPPSPLTQILLTSGRALALQLNDRLGVRVVHNAPLLVEWRGHSEALPGSLLQLLEELLPTPTATEVMDRISAATESADIVGVALGTSVLRTPQGGGPDRYVALSLHRCEDAEDLALLLLLRDVTPQEGLQQALTRSQESLATTLAALRSSPQALRLFLSAALASVDALRATMKLPARSQEAAREKLDRLQDGTAQLAADAAAVGLDTVVEACNGFTGCIAELLESTHISGDDMLSLAPLLDRVASSIGDTIRIEQQRFIAPAKPQPGATRAASSSQDRKDAEEWARGASKRWASFLRHRSEETGKLVKLLLTGAQVVPSVLRRDIDDMLQHLLRNAIEHGIETPEQRLAAEKPATGEISVKFEDKGPRGILLTVQDDGRGFDIERIGKAAVLSGLVSEESLLEYDPGEIVGLIFKPTFSTQHLEGEAGRGRGMSFLRRAAARLGGQITVATKPGVYTRFVLQLPAHAEVAASGISVGPKLP